MVKNLNTNKEELKILSVDFDAFYYLGENYFDVQCFDIDWTLTYIRYTDLFSLVKNTFYYTEFEQIKSILKNNTCPVYVSEDHSYVALTLHNVYYGNDFNIINVDHHTDLGGAGYILHCGNWLKWLAGYENITHLDWIRFTKYSNHSNYQIFKEENRNFFNSFNVLDNLSSIVNEKFDLIFLIQSYEWSPPHMYHKWEELLESCKNTIIDCKFPLFNLDYKSSIERLVNSNILSYSHEDSINIYYSLVSETEGLKDCIIGVPIDIKPTLINSFGDDINYNYCTKLKRICYV